MLPLLLSTKNPSRNAFVRFPEIPFAAIVVLWVMIPDVDILLESIGQYACSVTSSTSKEVVETLAPRDLNFSINSLADSWPLLDFARYGIRVVASNKNSVLPISCALRVSVGES